MPHDAAKAVPRARGKRREWMRAVLPYGLWTCEDGREVLFNRRYEPIWQRRVGAVAEAADPSERVPWLHQSWLYQEDDPPWADASTLARLAAVLSAWGVPIPELAARLREAREVAMSRGARDHHVLVAP